MMDVSDIRTDGGTQSRAAISQETVAEYAEVMGEAETVFPPVVVYYDGKDYWLADGFHRVAAWKQIGRVEVPADVRQGTRRDAILHSCAANAAHGLRRSREDKRRAVLTLLEDNEWAEWSDREIARRVRVHHSTVAKYRAEVMGVTGYLASEPRSYTTKHGTQAKMDVAKIGAASRPDQEMEITPKPQENKAQEPFEQSESITPQEVDQETEASPDPYGYSRLTAEALLETAEGLRAELDEEKAARQTAEAEAKALKAEVKELTSGEDAGRKIGNLQRRLAQSEGRSKEHQANAARLQRQVNAQKAEIGKLRKQIEGQEITL